MAGISNKRVPLAASAYERELATRAEWAGLLTDSPNDAQTHLPSTSAPTPAAMTRPAVGSESKPADIWAKARAENGTAPVVIASDPSKAIWAAARACVDNVNAAHALGNASIWDQARRANG